MQLFCFAKARSFSKVKVFDITTVNVKIVS
jgi:hypothetical protein